MTRSKAGHWACCRCVFVCDCVCVCACSPRLRGCVAQCRGASARLCCCLGMSADRAVDTGRQGGTMVYVALELLLSQGPVLCVFAFE